MPEQDTLSRTDGSFLRLVILLLRHRFVIGSATLAMGLAVVLAVLVSRRHYTVSASFAPQTAPLPAGIGGLASQFGLALPGTDATQSPDFYASLLRSRQVYEGVVDTRYTVNINGAAVNGTLVDFLNSGGSTPALQREDAIKRLDELTQVDVSLKTGLVRLQVTMRYPLLAQRVAERFLELLNQFNLQTRQTQAAAERAFTGGRVNEVQGELKAAEDRQQQFLQRNRDFRNSPELTVANDRLSRDVAMRQDIYTTLMQRYEQSRIEEVRDTPVITVVERPELPVRPDSRGGLRKVLLGCILGGVLGFLMALRRELIRTANASPVAEVADLLRLQAELFDDLRHPIRALGRELVQARSAARSST